MIDSLDLNFVSVSSDYFCLKFGPGGKFLLQTVSLRHLSSKGPSVSWNEALIDDMSCSQSRKVIL